MKTLRQMMKLNEHREQVSALAAWAKSDPWKGLVNQLNESASDPAADRVVAELTRRIQGV